MDANNQTPQPSAVNTPPVSSPIIEAKTSSSNILPLLIVALVCLLIGGGGGYWLGKQQSSPETDTPSIETISTEHIPTESQADSFAAWKIYGNTQNKFSFRYPSEFRVVTNEDSSIQLEGNNSLVLTVITYENADQLSLTELDEILKRNADCCGEISPELSMATTSVILGGGLSAWYREDAFCEPTRCDYYVVSNGDKVYKIITFPEIDPNGQDNREYIKEILTSFQFGS